MMLSKIKSILFIVVAIFIASNIFAIKKAPFYFQNILVLNDPGISALVSPSTSGCYNSSVSVIVTIQNFGTNAISNIPVSVIISGPINQTVSSTYVGVLGIGASVNFNVGNANMSYGGVYTFSSSTNLIGDGNNNNNSFVTTRTVTPNVFISGPSTACFGNSLTLTASGATSYTWGHGPTTNTVSVSPSVSTTYSVVGTNTAGCTAIYQVTLAVQNPTISASGAIACGNPGFGTLTASAFTPATVNWYATPVSTNVIGSGTVFTVSAVSTTTYYAEANSTFPGSLFTTVNGGNSALGNMFNVSAVNTLTIDGLDMHFNSAVTTTVEVWYRNGSFVGFETNNVGWTQVLSTTVIPAGTGTLTTIPGTFAIPVNAGQTVAVYVTANGGGSGVNYTNGTGLGNLLSSNNDLQLFEGKGGSYFNVTSSPRKFNGILRYNKPGCVSPRVPATFSVVPGITVTAIGTHSALCSGESVTLTGGGAVNYTWSPNFNISPSPNASVIVASPNVFTTYTVTGTIPSCTQVSTFTVALTVIPGPTLTVSPPIGILPGSVITLTAGGAFTYSWTPGGSNNANILVNPGVTTAYTVSGTNAFGCKSSVTTTVFISAVGISELNNGGEKIIIFPNPSEGIIYLNITSAFENFIVEITDINSKVILTKSVNQTYNKINITEITSGIYQYRILTENKEQILNRGKIIRH